MLTRRLNVQWKSIQRKLTRRGRTNCIKTIWHYRRHSRYSLFKKSNFIVFVSSELNLSRMLLIVSVLDAGAGPACVRSDLWTTFGCVVSANAVGRISAVRLTRKFWYLDNNSSATYRWIMRLRYPRLRKKIARSCSTRTTNSDRFSKLILLS